MSWLAAVWFLLGLLAGAALATHFAAHLLARLPAGERLEFARKVRRLADARHVRR